MNVLYDMINEKAKARWGKAVVDLDNFPVWSECWFNTALEMKEDFKKEGLVDTAQAMADIIVVQRGFFPKKKAEITSVGKLEPVLKSETSFENENVLPDDYPIYADYLYVCDGKVYRSIWHGITVRQLKVREKFKEVRRCNIVVRRHSFLEGK